MEEETADATETAAQDDDGSVFRMAATAADDDDVAVIDVLD